MISRNVAPSGRFNISNTMAFLLPGRATGAAFLGVASLLVLPRFGATLGAGGATGASRRWMASQIRLIPVLRSVNFFTGLRSPKSGVPAKLFQLTGQSGDHLPAKRGIAFCSVLSGSRRRYSLELHAEVSLHRCDDD
jgi:hypothetical protein